jgi:transcriptional regulator with XRE-family HTH domain
MDIAAQASGARSAPRYNLGPAVPAPATDRVGGTVQEIVDRCASNLRRLRRARDMSVSELARRSGVAKGTLSTLESGSGNPTVETLWSLAGALGVPMADLLAEVTEEAFVVRSAANPELAGRNVKGRTIDRVFGREVFDIIEGTLPADLPRRVPGHPPGTITRLYVVHGALRVELPHETIELEDGDFIRFAADVPHVYTALGADVRILGVLNFTLSADDRTSPLHVALSF